MPRQWRKFMAVIVIILVCLLAITHSERMRKTLRRVETAEAGVDAVDVLAPLIVLGGSSSGRHGSQTKYDASRASKSIIIDTLNLVHWLHRHAPLKKVETCDIIGAIDKTAPIIRKAYTDRVVYVTKSRETPVGAEETRRLRALYRAAASRNKVYISIVEHLPERDPGGSGHASLGRDDFYMILLAHKMRAPVLSRDRFRDLASMKTGELGKFHVILYSPVKDLPERDYVNPAAAEFRRLRRPRLVDYPEVLDDC